MKKEDKSDQRRLGRHTNKNGIPTKGGCRMRNVKKLNPVGDQRFRKKVEEVLFESLS